MNEIKVNNVLLRDGQQWLHFTQPRQIIVAKTLDEVIPALLTVERRIEQEGLHAAGFLSYESAPAFDPSHLSKPTDGFPYLWFGLYSEPRAIDLPAAKAPKPVTDWHATIDRDTHNSAVEKVREYIAQGQTYQVNYTMRLQADFTADPWNFFLHLIQGQHNHAAYIDTGRYVICSASPELFFQLHGTTITCRPMKGTVTRGRTTSEDKHQAEWLRMSEKNRAENVMIVDMIRNDLGRIARIGSVRVAELFTVEKYPTLWQMISTVHAETSASVTNILKALFPCASITGAPKVSTMRIISELEGTPRRIYTGSIGHISPNGKATFNVAIRTALLDRESQIAEYGVGGGVVWDSTSVDEYAEALLKARILTGSSPQFSLFETMLWTPEAGFFLRDKHIARLLDSAEYFDFPVNLRWSSNPNEAEDLSRPASKQQILEGYLDDISSPFTTPQRVRLLLNEEGTLSYEAKPFQRSVQTTSLRVRLAPKPINSANVFLFHKTTYRDIYETALSDCLDCDDVLLYNEHNELTEFTIGNLVVEMERRLHTPPISCGLLAGTFRAHLLETGKVQERVIYVEDLKKCTKIFLVNSVKKWCKATFAE